MPQADNFIDAIMNHGFETLAIALIINILTAIMKMPIKYIANKRADGGAVVKKFITLLPITLGFALTVAYTYVFPGKVALFNAEFMTLWLTSSSLSLALYAITEKFFPAKEKDEIFTDERMYRAYRLIESLSGIDDVKDLKTLAKLVYNKFAETNASESGDYRLIEDVLKGLIPNECLEAVSKAVFEMMKQEAVSADKTQKTVDVSEVKTAEEEDSSMRAPEMRIILKGRK